MTEIKSLDFKIISVVLLLVNVFIFKTLVYFDNFLSRPLVIGVKENFSNGTVPLGDENVNTSFRGSFHSLALDICLIELFHIQHSLLKKPIQKILHHWGFEYLERSVFNLLSATVLQILIHFWVPVTSWALWDWDIEVNSLAAWSLYLLRSLTWLALLAECIVLDISDLLGWKQVVHHFAHLPPPAAFRSPDLNLTLANMRHPGIIELSVLLWATPTLSLDRLVCSALLTLYVILGFSGQCAAYVQRERQRKMAELAEDRVGWYGGCSPSKSSKRVRFRVPLSTGKIIDYEKDF